MVDEIFLTDNEIIKAFVCCYFKGECNKCPNKRNSGKSCKKILELTLDLLNRQKAKIENLLKEKGCTKDIESNNVKCIDCEYLELKLPYGVCSKAYKMVSPDDSCGKGKLEKAGVNNGL